MEATSFFHFGRSDAEQVHILAYFPPRFLLGERLEQTFLFQRGLRAGALARIYRHLARRAARRRSSGAGSRWRADGAARGSLSGSAASHRAHRGGRPQLFRHFIRSHVRFWSEDRELFGWTPAELIDAILRRRRCRYRGPPSALSRQSRAGPSASGGERGRGVYLASSSSLGGQFRAFAEAHGKLWTASTDDHQKPDAPYTPPESPTPAWVVERF